MEREDLLRKLPQSRIRSERDVITVLVSADDRFAELNVRTHTGRTLETRLVDWRRLPTNLGRYDYVIGSDVLYERSYGALVARAIDVTLAQGGEAVIADPGRVSADEFIRDAAKRGLHIAGHGRVPFVEGQIRQQISLYRLRR